MTLSFMRQLDRWIGTFFCFLLTLVNYLSQLFPQKTTSIIPKKILFIKPSELGGILLSYPLILFVQKECPNVEIFYLVFKSNEPLFEVLDIIPARNIITIREDSFIIFLCDISKAFFRIRHEKVDVAFDLEFFSRFTAIISYLSGASKRIGFDRYTCEGLYRGNLATHKIQYNPHLHISKMFLSLGQVLSMPEKNTPEFERNLDDHEVILPKFVPTEEQKREILNKFDVPQGARLFLVNPGEGKLFLREWPVEHFVHLTNKLLEQENNYIVIVGTKEGLIKAKVLQDQDAHKNRYINLCGRTSIRELLTLFSLAEALVTNDGGLAHLASLTSIKQFVFFGPETPRIFSPLGENTHVFYANLPCSPCFSAYNHRKSTCQNNRCLQLLDPLKVCEVILEKTASCGKKGNE